MALCVRYQKNIIINVYSSYLFEIPELISLINTSSALRDILVTG